MPVSSWALSALVLVVPARLSSTLGTRTPAKAGEVQMRPCRHGLIWDHTVFHVVASCRANPAMVAPLDAHLSDEPVNFSVYGG